MVRSLDPLQFDDIESNTITYTQQNVTALMIRFYNDCTGDNGNYIPDNKMCSIKSSYSGLSLTGTNKGLRLEDARTAESWRSKSLIQSAAQIYGS